MKRLFGTISFILLLSGFSQIVLAGANVSGIRMWDAPDNTRIVFDLSQPTGFSVFTLRNPDRVVIDLFEASLNAEIPQVDAQHNILNGLRSAVRNRNNIRVVLDTRAPLSPRSFLLKPHEDYGHRLVVDLDHPVGLKPRELKVEPVPVVAREKPAKAVAKVSEADLRDIVIAIDAGHGGEDPGARGRRYKTNEKDVTLKIARKLAEMVSKEQGMRAVLVRDGDYYVSLRKRIEIARQHKADLFVSIHADAYKSSNVKGASVYVLSAKGASDEASRWLERSENAADLVGGVSLGDKDEVLASVLLDLSLTGTIDVSTRVADNVLDEIAKVTPVRKKDVQFARFVVLKSPDIPSMLVETAFISNPQEERRLRDPAYQRQIAFAMLNGIKGYFQTNPPPNTYLAEKNRIHRIRAGETLSSIADHYKTTVTSLKRANDLHTDLVQAGQTLHIPF